MRVEPHGCCAAPSLAVRYDRRVADPAAVAEELGGYVDAPIEQLTEALLGAHAESVGRYVADLTDEQLADVMDEAGDLLRELGYLR